MTKNEYKNIVSELEKSSFPNPLCPVEDTHFVINFKTTKQILKEYIYEDKKKGEGICKLCGYCYGDFICLACYNSKKPSPLFTEEEVEFSISALASYRKHQKKEMCPESYLKFIDNLALKLTDKKTWEEMIK